MADRGTATPNGAGIRAFVARRPVTAFLIMAFAIAYPLMALVALAVHRVIPGGLLLDRLPFPPDEIAGLMLTMFALLPSALFVTWAANGRPGVISLVKRITRWRFGIGWWLAVLAGLPVLTVIFTLILGGSLESIDPVGLFWDQLRLLLINFILVNLWEETAWAGVVQTRLEHLHNIFVAAALTAVPFGFIHLPLAFLSEVTLASVLISLAAYILLGLFLRPLVGVVLRGSRDSLLAAGLMHSVFNRTNNDNGIAAALLNGELYRVGVLIAVVVLIAALALTAGRRRLSKNYRLELDTNPGGAPADDTSSANR
ncbi:MAG TPA: type II CAAX endopeptidase family protein [Propionibacteriaceae bacterium]|nr:type II CAAX endopeptidase family protein [Propionibacteriaceae bacterium]